MPGSVFTREGASVDVGVTSTVPPLATGSGGVGLWRQPGDHALRFDDVHRRARRLVQWAQEESRYLHSHDVALFSDDDVLGRDRFADEGLYELLPQLLADAATLRLHCGRGVLWQEIKVAVEEAADGVQRYYLLWQTMRDRRAQSAR